MQPHQTTTQTTKGPIMLNNIRKTIASFIAPKAVVINATQEELAKARSITRPDMPKHILTQHERATTQPTMAGKFHVADLERLSSDYLKDSIAQYGTWQALAKAFAEYERVTGNKNADDNKMLALLDEFHSWNAATSTNKQYTEETVLDVIARLSQVPAAKGSDATDSIIARVRKCSIEEVRAARQKEAERKTALREANIEGFAGVCWQFTMNENNPFISGAKAASKALQTLEFVATSWTGDPANIAAELLLMESDIKVIEHIAKMEELREGENQTPIAEYTGKREYKHDPAKEISVNAKLDRLNYEAWLAEQQAS